MRIRLQLEWHRHVERWAQFVAEHLPRRVRQWVITNAAVRYRQPDVDAGDRYCGPDGISYHDLYEHA